MQPAKFKLLWVVSFELSPQIKKNETGEYCSEKCPWNLLKKNSVFRTKQRYHRFTTSLMCSMSGLGHGMKYIRTTKTAGHHFAGFLWEILLGGEGFVVWCSPCLRCCQKPRDIYPDPDVFEMSRYQNVQRFMSNLQGYVCKGTGSQSVMICVTKYPGGESQQQVS